MLLLVVIGCVFTLCGLLAQAKGCGGMIVEDNGTLEIHPYHRACLWVISLQNTDGLRLHISSLLMTPMLVIPQHRVNNLQSIWINGSKDVIHNFKAKSIAVIVTPFGYEKMTLTWHGLITDNSKVSSSIKFISASEERQQWEHEGYGRGEIIWAFHYGTIGLLKWNLDTLQTCLMEDPCDRIFLAVVEVMPDGKISEFPKTCGGSSEGSIKVAKSSKVLIILQVNHAVESLTKFNIKWKYDENFKVNIEGIIVGSYDGGLLVIPFNSTESRINDGTVAAGLEFDWHSTLAYSVDTEAGTKRTSPIAYSSGIRGVAFCWNSSQLYWLQDGIMRANLNGSDSEVLLSDRSSKLRGLAIEPISGNLYYGNRSSGTIRVCNIHAKNCSSIAKSNDLSDVFDVAIHGSRGFLFWTIVKKKVVRANLDGSDETIILDGHDVYGIGVDEDDDRLYWGSLGIYSCDLSGRDIRMLPMKVTFNADVVIDGENIYYSNWDNSTINVLTKLGTNSKLVANLRHDALYLGVFGTIISNLPQNPCDQSKCAHLCVLTSPSSFRCACADGEKLDLDGTSCRRATVSWADDWADRLRNLG